MLVEAVYKAKAAVYVWARCSEEVDGLLCSSQEDTWKERNRGTPYVEFEHTIAGFLRAFGRPVVRRAWSAAIALVAVRFRHRGLRVGCWA